MRILICLFFAFSILFCAHAEPALPRQWWVYLSPDEARELYRVPNFALIKAEADTFFSNGVPWVKTGIDHSSVWIAQQSSANEMLAAVYMALKWGKYHGAASPETQAYLDRLLFNWRDIVTAGPVELYQTSQPHHPGQYGGHGEPKPFSPGWYEGDIALRGMMGGGLTSYDAIRDDIPAADREMIDAWMRGVAPKLWANTNSKGQNRGASSHGQAQEMALLVQDRKMFEAYYWDKMLGFWDALTTLNYAPSPECWFPQRAGISLQCAYDDGPHGININKHILDTLLHISHAARNGGDPAWDISRFYDQKLVTDICDTWFDIGGPLHYPFAFYMRSVEASQNVQLSTTPTSVTGWTWFVYAWIQPRFNDIGTSYGTSKWNWGNGMWAGANGQIALWKERARLLAGVPEPVAPPEQSVYETKGRGVIEVPLSPQRGVFTAEFDVLARDANVKTYLFFEDFHAQKEGGKPAFGMQWASGQFEAESGAQKASLPWNAGTNYHVRQVVDLRAKTYSIFIKPEGAAEEPLAKDFAFHNPLETIRYWAFKPDGSPNFEVRNFRITQPEAIQVRIANPFDQATFRDAGNVQINADTTAAKVEFYAGLTKIGESNSAPFSFRWANVPAGEYMLTARAIGKDGIGRDSQPVQIVVGKKAPALPPNWLYQDIGDGKIAGDAHAEGATFVMRAPGQEINGKTDELGMTYQFLGGDGEIVARVADFNPIFKRQRTGVMIRASLEPDASHACIAIRNEGGLEFISRETKGGDTKIAGASTAEKAPFFLKLTRSGNTLTGYKSADGKQWTLVGSAAAAMTGDVLVGLIANTGIRGNLNTAKFDNVAVTGKVTALPAPPSSLTASASGTQVSLTWKDNAASEEGWVVERSSNGITFAQIAKVGANPAAYADKTDLQPGTTYTYRVRAFNKVNTSDPSNSDSATTAGSASAVRGETPRTAGGTPTLPGAPTALKITVVSESQLDLDWTNSGAVEGLEIERSRDGTHFAPLAKLRGNLAHFADAHLQPSTSLAYRVSALNTAGRSPFSNIANATTKPPLPEPPTGFAVTPKSPAQIDIAWQPLTKNQADVKVFRTSGNKISSSGDLPNYKLIGTVAAGTNTLSDKDVKADFSYAYRAVATDAAGRESAFCDIVRMNTPGKIPRPATPSGLSAKPNKDAKGNPTVDLTWTSDGANLDGFKIERSDDGTRWTQMKLPAAKDRAFTDGDIVFPGTKYFYRIRAYSAGGNVNSDFSSPVSVLTSGDPPVPI